MTLLPYTSLSKSLCLFFTLFLFLSQFVLPIVIIISFHSLFSLTLQFYSSINLLFIVTCTYLNNRILIIRLSMNPEFSKVPYFHLVNVRRYCAYKRSRARFGVNGCVCAFVPFMYETFSIIIHIRWNFSIFKVKIAI